MVLEQGGEASSELGESRKIYEGKSLQAEKEGLTDNLQARISAGRRACRSPYASGVLHDVDVRTQA